MVSLREFANHVTKNYYCHYRISKWEEMGSKQGEGPLRQMTIFHKPSVNGFLLIQWLSNIGTCLRLVSSEVDSNKDTCKFEY